MLSNIALLSNDIAPLSNVRLALKSSTSLFRKALRSLFVFFTDAKHGLAGINTLALVGGTCIVTIGEKREWWEYLIDLGIMSVGRSIGFYTVYNVIYK